MNDYNPEKEQRHMLTRDKGGKRLVDTINPNLYKVGMWAMERGIVLPNDVATLRKTREQREKAKQEAEERAAIERERQRQATIKARNAELLTVIAIEEKTAIKALQLAVLEAEQKKLDKRMDELAAKASDTVATHQEPLISLAFDTAYVYEPKAGKLVEKRRTA